MDRIIFKKIIFFVLLAAILLLGIRAFFIEPAQIKIRKIDIHIPDWHKEHNGLKIAVLSDFHLGFGVMNKAKLAKIIDLTNSQNPDLIMLLGDYVNVSIKNEDKLPLLLDFKDFRSKYGIYAVMGNHEGWSVRDKIRKYLKEADVNLLENRADSVTINEKSFWVAGIEDLSTGYPDAGYTIRQINDENPVIFLSHNPEIFQNLPEEVDLALAGHTHGGQIYIPFLVNLLSQAPKDTRFLKGHVVRNGQNFFTSSGIGTTIIPARLFAPPEIIILTLSN